ncbi:LysR substrate-binding domain-containing protein [Pseudomonas corrugata]|uniref:LysR substrate-binding domain-containing protein n=1 Tax=Pseudomonas corrugata TaxID=47879 RepID=UPI0028C398C2|nr:LysR substrate-binding domain-containing protein [Pseudomonas corrugata]MDU9024456.1 LysR substrate-binding domain-containing protein [Pseudomonas corrugata]
MDRNTKSLPPVGPLVFFEAVARTGSFTQAAQELFITQSAVSKQVKKLEENLGFPLFTRKHRGVVLTDPGRALYEGVQPALESFRETVQRVRKWYDQNTISVVCTHAVAHYYLFPRLAHFQQQFPDVIVNVVATNQLSASLCLEHDFGILYGAGKWPGLSAVKLFDEIVYPICSPGFAVDQIETFDELQKQSLIQIDNEGWDVMNWNDWLSRFGQQFKPTGKVITYNQVTLALNAAERGLGIALGWEFMAREMIEKGAVKPLSQFELRTGFSDFLVHSNKAKLSNACKTFEAWLLQSTADDQ